MKEVMEIRTVDDLIEFRRRVKKGECHLNAVLKNDLVFTKSDNKKWGGTPISGPKNYRGVFDGQGHAIRNIQFYNKSSSYDAKRNVTLFDHLYLGVIKNLTVDTEIRESDEDKGLQYCCHSISFICNINEGLIENCRVTGKISITVDWEGNNPSFGGIASANMGYIQKCSSDIDMDIKGNRPFFSAAGGICSYNKDGEIIKCVNKSNLQGESCVGGICGVNHGDIIGCVNKGDVSGFLYVSGITGQAIHDKPNEIKFCKNEGEIKYEFPTEDFKKYNSFKISSIDTLSNQITGNTDFYKDNLSNGKITYFDNNNDIGMCLILGELTPEVILKIKKDINSGNYNYLNNNKENYLHLLFQNDQIHKFMGKEKFYSSKFSGKQLLVDFIETLVMTGENKFDFFAPDKNGKEVENYLYKADGKIAKGGGSIKKLINFFKQERENEIKEDNISPNTFGIDLEI